MTVDRKTLADGNALNKVIDQSTWHEEDRLQQTVDERPLVDPSQLPAVAVSEETLPGGLARDPMNAAVTDVREGTTGVATDNKGLNSFDLTDDERHRESDRLRAGKV